MTIIIARRWFDHINGNTYHSVLVNINGENIAYDPFSYGYNDHYKQTAFDLLKKGGYEKGERFPWPMSDRVNRKKYFFSVTDVHAKKELAILCNSQAFIIKKARKS